VLFTLRLKCYEYLSLFDSMHEITLDMLDLLKTNDLVVQNIFLRNLMLSLRIDPQSCYPDFVAFHLNITTLLYDVWWFTFVDNV